MADADPQRSPLRVACWTTLEGLIDGDYGKHRSCAAFNDATLAICARIVASVRLIRLVHPLSPPALRHHPDYQLNHLPCQSADW